MISDLTGFRKYIKVMLGGSGDTNGQVNIEISNEQLNQCIEDSVQLAQRHLGGEGHYEDYLILTLSAGVSAYSLSGANISSVVNFAFANAAGGINTLFSPINLFFQGKFDIYNYNFSLASYEIYSNYIETVNRMFAVEYKLVFNELTQNLVVLPTPNAALAGALKVYKKEVTENLYNHVLVKGLALAKAKRVLARGYKKYQGFSLPGEGEAYSYGIQLEAEGKQEEDEYMIRIRSEGEPLGMFWG